MELSAPAKINLFLKVIGRRPDGFHELLSLMCGVALYDRLTLTFDTGTSGIECSTPDLPCDGTNLALKAAMLFHRVLGQAGRIKPTSVFIHLQKIIPMGAGLGGGSSDAAAVLKGLNTHYRHPLGRQELMEMALELGADVPFFIDVRPAFARGVGEKLSPYTGLPDWAMVIVYPGTGLSTAEVFQNFNLRLTKGQKEIRNFPFNNGDFNVPEHLCNDLEPAAIKRCSVIAEIKKALLNHGARGALMTGSGSAVFGLFESPDEARRAGSALERDTVFRVFVTRILV